MIYTVTLNPSLDCVTRLDRFQPGALNRAAGQRITFGGKGLNVSVMLRRLGVDSTALGFTAGSTGRELERLVQKEGIDPAFVTLDDGMTRINLKLIADGETEINPPGPAVNDAAMARLLGELDAVVPGDTVVIAGSAPCGQPNARETVLQRAAERGADTVVDAAGEALIRALSYRPFLIKPNRAELSEAAGRDLPDDDAVIAAAGELQKKGARHVLVSLGGDGGLLIEESGRVHRVRAPAGRARYTVGAGDSMLAGFLAGWQKTGDPAYALRMGIAAGSATAFSDDLADRAAIERIFQTLF